MTCHCGRKVDADHWQELDDPSEPGFVRGLAEIHATRCCGCADAFAFGAPFCDECERAGEAEMDAI